MSALSDRGIRVASWHFVDLTAGELGERGGAPASDAEYARIEHVFATAKADFAAAGESLRKLVSIFVLLVGVSVVVAISGLVIAAAFRAVVAGTTMSIVGTGAMLALFAQIHRVGRDQALFQFMISKYELMIKLSPKQQYRALLAEFMREVSILRDKPLRAPN